MRPLQYLFILSILTFWLITAFAADNQEKKMVWVSSDQGKAGLGLVLTNLDDDDAEIDAGARVLNVIDDSEAEKAGIKKNDIIIEINGTKIQSLDEVQELLKNIEEDQEVKLIALRNGSKQTFKVKKKPFKSSDYTMKIDGDHTFFSPHSDHNFSIIAEDDFDFQKNEKGAYLGVQVKELSDQLLEYFNVDHGVLVEEVMDESSAKKAGLKAGDVITQINDRKIADYNDLIRTVNYYNPGEQVEVIYVRKGKSEKVSIVLGEKKRMQWQKQADKTFMIDEFDHEDLDEDDDNDHKIKKRIKIKSPKGEIKDIKKKILLF
jgi:C-terminal processing protease CtpA/Prc